MTHRLSGLRGKSLALLRFAFGSDDSIERRGVVFDNIQVLSGTKFHPIFSDFSEDNLPTPQCPTYVSASSDNPLYIKFYW